MMSPSEKVEAYRRAGRRIKAVLAGETHAVAKMATINSVLRDALPYYFWTGFYLAEAGELIVGPYQGTLGCLRIPFGRGVCGAAARTRTTQVVPDVRAFPGHIACDSRSRSEIVVPVFGPADDLLAVFDVDSTEPAAFDGIDREHLERILHAQFTAPAPATLCRPAAGGDVVGA